MKVSAKDKGTGKEQSITISGSTALSDEEVDRMVNTPSPTLRRTRSRRRKSRPATRPTPWCYSTEQTLAELGDKVSGDLKSKAESAIADAKKALEGSDIEAPSKSAGEALQSVAYELARVWCTPTLRLPRPVPTALLPPTTSMPSTRSSTTRE